MEDRIDDLLCLPFMLRSFEEQQTIIQEGKPCPALPNIYKTYHHEKSQQTRRFSVSHYETVEWLTGSRKRLKLFCWPCVLFSKEQAAWNKIGFSDLKHLTSAQQRHEKSQIHVLCDFKLKLFSRNGRPKLEASLDSQRKSEISQHNEHVKKNREHVKRIIDAVCYLVKQELPLKSHSHSDESSISMNKGNYIELLNLMKHYDCFLDTHLSTSNVFQGSSLVVQNDVIESLSFVLKECIKRQVDAATYVAIILDETSEVVSRSQLSTVLRFVHEGKVCERFIGFSDLSSDRTSDGLFNHVVSIVQEFQLEDKLIGQSYDGASVMNGHLCDLQRKVRDAYPSALFTHCHGHILSLVLQQSLSIIKECRIFFHFLHGLASYFSESAVRLHSLNEFVNSGMPNITLTGWNFTNSLSTTVHKYKSYLIEFFRNVVENSENWDADSFIKAQGFLHFLEDLQTSVLLEVFAKLFGYTDALYDTLQHKIYDVLYCCKKIYDVLQQLKFDKEYGFDNLWDAAIVSPTMYDGDEQKPKRQKLDILDRDTRDSFHDLYGRIIDVIHMQIDIRYSSFNKLAFFQLLWHKKYEEYRIRFPEDLLVNVKDSYGSLFDFLRLKNELNIIFTNSEFSDKSVHGLLQFITENDLKNCFKEVYKLAELILAIPSNAPPAGHSVSALKCINTCYRASQGQERLCGPGFLAIERELLMELKLQDSFYEDVLTHFALHTYREELTYK